MLLFFFNFFVIIIRFNFLQIQNGISNLISSALIKTYGESSTMELCKSMVIEEQIKADEHRSRAELWANELDKQINELREGVKV